MEHLSLPPGETLLLPDNVKIPADPGKIVAVPDPLLNPVIGES